MSVSHIRSFFLSFVRFRSRFGKSSSGALDLPGKANDSVARGTNDPAAFTAPDRTHCDAEASGGHAYIRARSQTKERRERRSRLRFTIVSAVTRARACPDLLPDSLGRVRRLSPGGNEEKRLDAVALGRSGDQHCDHFRPQTNQPTNLPHTRSCVRSLFASLINSYPVSRRRALEVKREQKCCARARARVRLLAYRFFARRYSLRKCRK